MQYLPERKKSLQPVHERKMHDGSLPPSIKRKSKEPEHLFRGLFLLPHTGRRVDSASNRRKRTLDHGSDPILYIDYSNAEHSVAIFAFWVKREVANDSRALLALPLSPVVLIEDNKTASY